MRAIQLWPYTIAVTTFNIHGSKVRQLLRLPVRKGQIKSVSFNPDNETMQIVFEKFTSHKLTIK